MKNYIAAVNKNTVELSVEVALIKEGDYIVAYCPALELSSFGDTEQDAQQAFEEALEIFLEETSARGTLEKVLLDLGWGLRKLPDVEYTPPVNYSLKYPGSIQSKFKEVLSIPV